MKNLPLLTFLIAGLMGASAQEVDNIVEPPIHTNNAFEAFEHERQYKGKLAKSGLAATGSDHFEHHQEEEEDATTVTDLSAIEIVEHFRTNDNDTQDGLFTGIVTENTGATLLKRSDAQIEQSHLYDSAGDEPKSDPRNVGPETQQQGSHNIVQPSDTMRDQQTIQQIKHISSKLNIEQLQQLLSELREQQIIYEKKEQERVAQHVEGAAQTVIDVEEYDERTLLDIFGDVAKEYLTKKVVRVFFDLMPLLKPYQISLVTPCSFT
jgi:hypothetical protein